MNLARILVTAVVVTGLAFAQHHGAHAAPAESAAGQAVAHVAPSYIQKSTYPLTTCVVSDEALEGDKVKTFEAGGRTFMTCCGKCQSKVEKDPAKYAAKLDAAIVAQQLAAYPLQVCPVSGQELGKMGEPHDLVLNGTLVRLCCEKCVDKAMTDADAIVQRIHDASYAAQKASYPMTTCVVSGEPLGEKSKDVMFGTTLVRLCCQKCVGKFEADQAGYMAKLAAARAGAKAEACVPGSCCEGAEEGGCQGEAKSGDCCDDADKGEAKSGGCCDEN